MNDEMNWQNSSVIVGWSLRGGADALLGVAAHYKKTPYPSTKTLLLKYRSGKDREMSLTAKDKALVKALWGKISGKADAIGQEALAR